MIVRASVLTAETSSFLAQVWVSNPSGNFQTPGIEPANFEASGHVDSGVFKTVYKKSMKGMRGFPGVTSGGWQRWGVRTRPFPTDCFLFPKDLRPQNARELLSPVAKLTP
jgi:hypothetical protein